MIAIPKPARRDLGRRPRREEDLGAGARAKLGRAGQVIGMRVGLDHEAQAQPALLDLSQVNRDAVGPRIDQRGVAGATVLDEIREAVVRAHLVHDESMGH